MEIDFSQVIMQDLAERIVAQVAEKVTIIGPGKEPHAAISAKFEEELKKKQGAPT